MGRCSPLPRLGGVAPLSRSGGPVVRGGSPCGPAPSARLRSAFGRPWAPFTRRGGFAAALGLASSPRAPPASRPCVRVGSPPVLSAPRAAAACGWGPAGGPFLGFGGPGRRGGASWRPPRPRGHAAASPRPPAVVGARAPPPSPPVCCSPRACARRAVPAACGRRRSLLAAAPVFRPFSVGCWLWLRGALGEASGKPGACLSPAPTPSGRERL